MYNFAKRVTSAVVAGAVVLGTLAFYPSGNKGQVNAAQLYDSASAINYSTILGGAVDYGVVAQTIIQTSHTETSFATNHFIHVKDNIDVDYIDSTALFLVGIDYEERNDGDLLNRFIRFGKTTASDLYFEAPEAVFGSTNSEDYNYFDRTKPALKDTQNGNFNFEREYEDQHFIYAFNDNAYSNVNRIINRICSEVPVEDAEKGWSYFLQTRANSSSYALDNQYIYISDSKDNVVIHAAQSQFDGKVVYVNVTEDMLTALSVASQFVIEKLPSSVVVLNIDSGTNKNGKLRIAKPTVTVIDGGVSTSYSGHTEPGRSATAEQKAEAYAIQENYNQTVIWNIMGSSDVELQCSGGAVLAPNAPNVSLEDGNSCGWVVTNGTFHMSQEFHFLYSSSSKDKYGDMHFALNKAFTNKYAEHGIIVQDTSVGIPDNNTYKFYFEEYTGIDSNGELTGATGNIKQANSTEQGAVIFPILNFSDPSSEYYLAVPSSGTSENTLYFKVTEDPNGAPSGIVNSDGYINIKITAKVDSAGNYTYFVNYRSVTGKNPATGNNIVFKDYETSDIKMSGVQFDLGVFYNRSIVPGYLSLTKTIDGLTDTEITVLKNNIEFDVLDKDGKSVLSQKLKLANDFTLDTTKGAYVLNSDKLIQVPDAEATYTVVESGYTSTGYQETVSYTVSKASQVQVQTVKPNEANITSISTKQDEPSIVAYKNSYTKNTVVTYGSLDITKSFGGDASSADFKNLSFEIYEVDTSTTPATETLKWTIPFNASNFRENNGTYELRYKRDLDTSKTYLVKEINYDVTGQTVTVEYKLPGGSNTQAVDGKSGTFSVAADNYADNPYVVAFTNSFTKSTNNVDISVSKRVLGTGSTYNELQGAKLTLTRTDDTSYVFTDDNFVAGNGVTGKVIRGNTISFVSGSTESAFRNLPDGTYTLEETDYPVIENVTYTKATTIEFEISGGIATQTAASTAQDNGIEGDTLGNQTLYLIDSPMGYIKIVKTLTGVNNLDDVAPIKFSVVNTADSSDTIDIPDLTSANCGTGLWVPNGNTYTYVIPTPIAVGNTYTVTESAPSSKTVGNTVYTLDASSSTDPVEVTVVGGIVDTAADATFKNVYTTSNATGSLSVKKIINSSSETLPSDVSAFIITVTFDTNIMNATISSGTKEGSVWTITAVPDTTYTISGVPDGASYTVKETGIFTTSVQSLTSEYEVTYTNATGTIDANATSSVTSVVTNKYTAAQPDKGYITLTKTVGGPVTASDVEGLTFTVYKSSDDSVVGTALTLKDDFELKSGTTDTYVLKNPIQVEAGESYYVVESNTAITGYDLVKVTYKLDGDTTASEITTASTFKTGTITPSATNTDTNAFGVEFTNEYKSKSTPTPAYITLTKTVGGPVTAGDVEGLTFTVYKSSDDSVVGTALTLKDDFELKSGTTDTYVLKNPIKVEAGESYYVVESNTAITGYDLVKVTYKLDGDTTASEITTASAFKTGTITPTTANTDTNAFGVEFTNEYESNSTPNGSLVINKTIVLPTGASLDSIGTITFEVTDSDGKNVATVVLEPGNPGSGWTANGNDFTYTVSPVTEGKEYFVKETCDTTSTSYTASSNVANNESSIVIPVGTPGSVAFTNTYSTVTVYTGSLVITKTIDLPSGATMADIGDITFTISPAAGGVSTVVLDPDNPGTGWTVNGNVFTYTISGLTQGESYDINESVDGSTSSYSVKVTRDTQGQVTIPIDSTNTSVSAGFTNTYSSTLPTVGYIEFTKTFGGDVTEAEAAGCGLYFVITNDAGEYLDLNGNISSDEVRITLKDMDHTDGTLVWSKTINDVPFDTYYVTEHNEVIYINGGKVPYTFEKTTSVTTDHTTLWNTSEDGYFDLENYYTHPGFDVTISKEDIAGKEIAQAQLKFKSLDGYDLSKVVVTQNGVPVQFTLSENNTAITFTTIEGYPSIIQGLFSGRYELEETVTPEAYLTAEKIVFVLNNDGTITDGEGKISAYGSPVVMIDQADPYYNTEVISANRTPNPIPATGEQSNYIAIAGIALVGLCSAALAGLGVYRKKRNEF